MFAGAVYAYILSKAPNTRITVAARSNYQIAKEKGLDYQSEKYGNISGYKFHNGMQRGPGTQTPAEQFLAVSSPNDPSLKNVDFKYIVCTHKAVHAEPSFPEQLAPVVGKDTTIVLIQNGVGIEEAFQAKFPNNTVLSGVTWVNAAQPKTGTIIVSIQY